MKKIDKLLTLSMRWGKSFLIQRIHCQCVEKNFASTDIFMA